jgi:uncharacterized protein (TIGR02466 family)
MPDFSNARYSHIFPTPLLMHEWEHGPAYNPLLRESILTHRDKSSGVSKSNHGGWHSEVGQLEFCGEPGHCLIQHMHEMADEATQRLAAEFGEKSPPVEWRITAWANINCRGDFNKTHVHPGSTWSGTYYVDAGASDEINSTPLHLFDPCPGRSSAFLPSIPMSIYIRPRPGLTVLFPSYVPHTVFPHDGDGERISIAFNLRKEPFP